MRLEEPTRTLRGVPTPPYLGGFSYDGTSGWVQLNAMVEPFGLHYACTVAATGNVLHPYGLHRRSSTAASTPGRAA